MERTKPGYKIQTWRDQNLDINLNMERSKPEYKLEHGEIQNLDIKSKHGEIKTWI